MGLTCPDYADFYVWVGGSIEWIPTVRYFGGFQMVFPNVDKERFYYGYGVSENIDIENPLTDNSVLENVASGIPDTEKSVFENLGAKNQFTENIDIENP
ncbi:hypothetical protein BUALT_Bualt16G0077400 [Buddleja alternifolia]|uniref:Uncharacterized protein n=1 Tax=Buddleja alternifolia TaxID=168488 RepID=A0AAV6WFA5_9LAMI|nr:hypothetical protein BUALT_Bualt16G0077400 [Buddleja alternifolia]